MKIRILLTVSVLSMLLISLINPAHSYTETTHSELSDRATEQSLLTNNDFLKSMGLNDFNNPQDFGEMKLNAEPFIQSYINAGSELEDIFPRSVNHFFDPLNDRALAGNYIGYKSPDWALEDKIEMPDEDQKYSLKDALEYYYQGLKNSEKDVRGSNFGNLFRSIGQVIHHVQDMAQPQHVRNDDHCNHQLCKVLETSGIYHPSLYEELTNDKRESLQFDGYEVTKFNTAREFWTTIQHKGIADFTSHNFISTGTNFRVDQLGNISTHNDFSYPVTTQQNVNDALTYEEIDVLLPDMGLTGLMAFVSTNVLDNNNPTLQQVNKRASTISIFDQDLQKNNACVEYTDTSLDKTYTYSTCRLFTYNSFNVEAAQKFLIPRAVGYSAGLINYFFRGRLDIIDIQWGTTGLDLTVHNISEGNFDLGEGSFEVYYDANDGLRSPATLISTGAVTELLNGQSTTLSLEIPGDVDLTKENPFILVFKGIIGEEQGIAAKVFNIPMRSLVFSENDLVEASYPSKEIYWSNGQWVVTPETTNRVGNIDWRGWYVNGMPTKVLSWKGPGSRHFSIYNNAAQSFSNKIFRDGKEAFRVPENYQVLGAALQKDLYDETKSWIIAICKDNAAYDNQDVVFRRPAIDDLSGSLYDPVLNPDGWQEIGRTSFSVPGYGGEPTYSFADQVWFFNGEGTEAQAIRWFWDNYTAYGIAHRLKITIPKDGVAQFMDMGGESLTWAYDSNISCSGPVYTSINTCEGGSPGTTGTVHRETHTNKSQLFNGTFSGSNIIAVDYKNDKEVFLSYHANEGHNTDHKSDYDAVYDASCRVDDTGDIVHSNVEQSIVDLETVNKNVSVNSYIRFPGEQNVTIDYRLYKQSISKKAQSSTADSNDYTNIYTSNSLKFIDLRYDVAFLRISESDGRVIVSNGQLAENVRKSKEILYLISKENKPKQVIRSIDSSVSFNEYKYRPINCDLQSAVGSEIYSSEPYNGYYRRFRLGIDLAGRVFYSYDFSYSESYNYLEGGDIEQIVGKPVNDVLFSTIGIK